jgi:hypothetical protein
MECGATKFDLWNNNYNTPDAVHREHGLLARWKRSVEFSQPPPHERSVKKSIRRTNCHIHNYQWRSDY